MTRKDKTIEQEIDAAYKRHGNGGQIPMLDLPKIYKAGMDAGRAGQDVDAAVKAAIQQYRKN